jgi:hypothetical protein
MGKKLLSVIRKQYKITKKDADHIIKTCLKEDMVSGGNGFVWINEEGQRIFEDALTNPTYGDSEVQMPKPPKFSKTVEELNAEYGIGITQMKDMVHENLDEAMMWIDSNGVLYVTQQGQDVLDDIISMPVIYRGQVIANCPNKRFVWARHRDRGTRVAVEVPRKLQGKLVGKMIYFLEYKEGNQMKYKWTRK